MSARAERAGYGVLRKTPADVTRRAPRAPWATGSVCVEGVRLYLALWYTRVRGGERIKAVATYPADSADRLAKREGGAG